MVRRTLISTAALVAAAMLICAPAHGIIGGQLAGSSYGAVGDVVFQPADGSPMFNMCTGFLISPTVFVTAGHCARDALKNQSSIGGTIGAIFDPTFDPAQSTFHAAASTVVHPDFNENALSTDVGVLVLAEPVANVDPIQLAAAGTADKLPNGTELTAVGYGRMQECGTALGHCEIVRRPARRYVTETLNATSRRFVIVQQNPNAQETGGVCYGDSGGPHLLAGTATVVAITTALDSLGCWSTSRDTRLDTPDVLSFLARFTAST